MTRQACIVLCLALSGTVSGTVLSGTACALAADRPRAIAGSVQPSGYPSSVPSARQYPTIEAGAPLAVDVYPRMVFAGSMAWIRLRIEPDPRSRSVSIEWVSDTGAGGSHLIDLDGDAAPIRVEFPLKRVESGAYEISATLLRSDGTRVTRATTLTVFIR
jgi:hypothetical protein